MPVLPARTGPRLEVIPACARLRLTRQHEQACEPAAIDGARPPGDDADDALDALR
jgi:hypothetical protein